MKTFAISKQQIIEDGIIEIDTINKDDIRTAEISFSNELNKFCIWFNGKLIHTCTTIGSINNRLSKLNDKFPLDI